MGGWVANVDTVDIGQEQIQHTRLEVLDGNFNGDSYSYGEGVTIDIALGADWLLAHHVYVARCLSPIPAARHSRMSWARTPSPS